MIVPIANLVSRLHIWPDRFGRGSLAGSLVWAGPALGGLRCAAAVSPLGFGGYPYLV